MMGHQKRLQEIGDKLAEHPSPGSDLLAGSDLLEDLRFLYQKYEKLTRQFRKVAHISDMLHARLEATNTELRESESRFRSLAHNAAAGIYVLQGRRFVLVNPAMSHILGYSEEELLREDFIHFIHPDYRKMALENALARQSGEPAPPRYELMIRTKAGEARWVELTAGQAVYGGRPSSTGTLFDITERKLLEERMTHMALHDTLTGLPNRILFEDRVEMAMAAASRRRGRLCLMFLDLDHFKPINDTLGHGVGDRLLQEVAARLWTLLRDSDTAARIGGDEFVILLPEIEKPEDASRVGEKIREGLRLPFEIEGHRLLITASIGIAIYPDHGTNLTELSKKADKTMYHAKESGRDCVRVCGQGFVC
ncbi:sensor domain-containing diguanylate cyclase [Desulfobotulus sp.]|jgi:diguanylate cyclase (GGDEF)-like protein/PAS domain S-box-containing protein|uniref:sensor domain-containing diguanylate cyclase n=1 Tax=Desulfobotulus sp. TaxID=1940337 RepID=UPI002A35B0A9|nr:sensor domain-containing diguanylate cyclase [Desulfobotulus sp.]MDY0162430.1 sensor domain-containing diguanylate cyclase [Desulfobotulus sp.]